MKRFLAVFTGSPGAMANWRSMAAGQLRERQAIGMMEWHDRAETNKGAIVELGHPWPDNACRSDRHIGYPRPHVRPN